MTHSDRSCPIRNQFRLRARGPCRHPGHGVAGPPEHRQGRLERDLCVKELAEPHQHGDVTRRPPTDHSRRCPGHQRHRRQPLAGWSAEHEKDRRPDVREHHRPESHQISVPHRQAEDDLGTDHDHDQPRDHDRAEPATERQHDVAGQQRQGNSPSPQDEQRMAVCGEASEQQQATTDLPQTCSHAHRPRRVPGVGALQRDRVGRQGRLRRQARGPVQRDRRATAGYGANVSRTAHVGHPPDDRISDAQPLGIMVQRLETHSFITNGYHYVPRIRLDVHPGPGCVRVAADVGQRLPDRGRQRGTDIPGDIQLTGCRDLDVQPGAARLLDNLVQPRGGAGGLVTPVITSAQEIHANGRGMAATCPDHLRRGGGHAPGEPGEGVQHDVVQDAFGLPEFSLPRRRQRMYALPGRGACETPVGHDRAVPRHA